MKVRVLHSGLAIVGAAALVVAVLFPPTSPYEQSLLQARLQVLVGDLVLYLLIFLFWRRSDHTVGRRLLVVAVAICVTSGLWGGVLPLATRP